MTKRQRSRPKLTEKKLKEFIADEKKGAKDYTKYGLKILARDERRHKKFLIIRLKSTKN